MFATHILILHSRKEARYTLRWWTSLETMFQETVQSLGTSIGTFIWHTEISFGNYSSRNYIHILSLRRLQQQSPSSFRCSRWSPSKISDWHWGVVILLIHLTSRETHKKLVKVCDAQSGETVRFKMGTNGGPSDNPMQSEISAHIGGKGILFCRKCEAGGTKVYKESDAGYHSLFCVHLDHLVTIFAMADI